MILGIDTSSDFSSVALVDETGVQALQVCRSLAGHQENLIPQIDSLFKSSSIDFSQIKALAIAVGPGSFTGLRIGIATAKSLAYIQNYPLIAISTLDALAANFVFPNFQICPMIDNKKGQVYTALYRFTKKGKLIRLSSDQAIEPGMFIKKIKNKTIFLGNGAVRFRNFIRKSFKRAVIIEHNMEPMLNAGHIATLALPLYREGKFADIFSLDPIYLAASGKNSAKLISHV